MRALQAGGCADGTTGRPTTWRLPDMRALQEIPRRERLAHDPDDMETARHEGTASARVLGRGQQLVQTTWRLPDMRALQEYMDHWLAAMQHRRHGDCPT